MKTQLSINDIVELDAPVAIESSAQKEGVIIGVGGLYIWIAEKIAEA